MRIAAAALLFATVAGAGCGSAALDAPKAPILGRFHLETTDSGGATVVLPRSEVRIAIASQPVLTEHDLAGVELVQVDLGRCLMFRVTPAATRDLSRLSAANQGRRLVLMLNDVAVGARRLDGPLADGTVLTFVELPDEELPALVEKLKKSITSLQREIARR